MSGHTILRSPRLVARVAARSSNPSMTSTRVASLSATARAPSSKALRSSAAIFSRRCFSTSPLRTKGIMPETDNPTPQPKPTEISCTVVDVSDGEYHELADLYLDRVLSRFEELQDQRDDVDIEYSAGVMTITIANKGTYVINKQPPNKQIWLSSPLSGPKRYDLCVLGESQGDKEGTAQGEWIYTRDGSSLSDLIMKELEVDVGLPLAH